MSLRKAATALRASTGITHSARVGVCNNAITSSFCKEIRCARKLINSRNFNVRLWFSKTEKVGKLSFPFYDPKKPDEVRRRKEIPTEAMVMRGSLYDGANIIFRAKRFCDRFIYGRVIIAEQKVLKC